MKYAKYVFVIITFIVLMMFMVACDEGLRIVDYQIEKYPDKLIYIIGEDYGLDLSGGEVRVLLKQGWEEDTTSMERFTQGYHNANFGIPGIYEVLIIHGGGELEKFPIQVVSKEQIRKMLRDTK